MTALAEPTAGGRRLVAVLPLCAAPQAEADARAEMQRHLARMRAIVEQTGIQAQP